MRSERESDEHTRLLDDSWPRDWSGSGNADDEQALRELREGLARGRGVGGARWEVPVRAAIAVAVLALVVAVVVVALLLRSRGTDEGVSIGESAPLVSTSVVESPPAESSPVASPSVESGGLQFRVHVVGQVRSPGVVSLGSDARVQDAIEAAGGATGKADLVRLNLARKVVDGERILVPKPGQKIPDEAPDGPIEDAGGSASGGGAVGPGAPIDLNAATATDLDALPGVGPVLAARIVEWRQANGRFTTVDDLNEVSGIGDATMEKLRPLVRV